MFKSPLRTDNNPTCSFYRNRSGDIILKDFSGAFYGNFISVVMYKYNLTYYRALRQIATDFGYIHSPKYKKNPKPVTVSTSEFKESKEANIQVEIQEYSKEELDWWMQFGITEEILKKFRVFSCKTVFLMVTSLHLLLKAAQYLGITEVKMRTKPSYGESIFHLTRSMN